MFSRVKFPTVKLVSVSEAKYTVLDTDVMLVVTAGENKILIPNATGSQRWLCINNQSVASAEVVVQNASGHIINASESIALAQYESVQLVDIAASLWTKI